MPLYDVPLVARGINISADTLDEAREYCEEDAVEFVQDWNWELRSEPTLAKNQNVRSTTRQEALLLSDLSVVRTDNSKDEETLEFTFDIHTSVRVSADNEASASEGALALFADRPQTRERPR